jgi:hypothetical protein
MGIWEGKKKGNNRRISWMAKGKKGKKRIGGIGRIGGEGWRKERRVSNGTGEMQMGRGKDGKKRRWEEEKLGRWADG